MGKSDDSYGRDLIDYLEKCGKEWDIEEADQKIKLKPETENNKIQEITRSFIAITIVGAFSLSIFFKVDLPKEMLSILSLIVGGVIGYYFGSSKRI